MGKKTAVEIDGVTYESVTEACKMLHVNRGAINALAWNKHIPIGDALYIHLHRVRDHEGRYFKSFTAMCAFHGVNKGTFFYRLNRGLSMEMCLSQEKWLGKSYEYVMSNK